MTLDELVFDVFNAAGEPPDLEYRDDALATITTNAQWQKLVRLVNEAQDAIAMWVHQDGRRMRIRLAEDLARLRALRQTRVIGTIVGTTLTLTTSSGERDYYRNWLIEGQTSRAKALVFMSYIGTGADILLLSEVEGTFVAAENVVLSKRAYQFADIAVATPPYADGLIYTDYTEGRPVEITGVLQTDGTELSIAFESEKLQAPSVVSGQPTSYSKSSLGLRFDVWPDDDYEYYVRFMRLPRPLQSTAPTSESELPPQFHRAIVLYCLWWLLLRDHETDKAYAVRRNFEDLLKRTQTEYDLQDRVQRGQMKLDMEG